jgi:hypothetical protein
MKSKISLIEAARRKRGMMPSFADITQVAKGETVPDWHVIQSMSGTPHERAVAEAAHHVWMWVSARANQGDSEFSETFLAWERNRPVFADDGQPGWRWDGVFGHVMVILWPSLNGKLRGRGRDREIEDTEEAMAIAFREAVSSYLKRTANMVNIYRGSPNAGDPDLRPPRWFISKEWADEPHARVIKAVPVTSPYKEGEREHERLARKMTPAEAGEDKKPAPVSVTYSCRGKSGCMERFSTAEDRAVHEKKHQEEAPVSTRTTTAHIAQKPQANGSRDPQACPACGLELSNPGNLSVHIKTYHPDLTPQIMKFACKVTGCKERYGTLRGLSQHLGTKGPHILTAAVRGAMITQAEEEAEQNEEPVRPLAEDVPKPQPPQAKKEPAVIVPEGSAPDREQRVVEYLLDIIAENKALKEQLAGSSSGSEEEIARLREELAEKDRKLAAARQGISSLTGLFSKDA